MLLSTSRKKATEHYSQYAISVEEFVSIVRLNGGNIAPNLLQEMMSNLVLSSESMAFVPKASKDDYTHQLFFRTKDLEILLCTWTPGQSTDLHSHKGNLAGVKILEGKLESHKYHWDVSNNHPVITDGIESKTLTTGDVDIIDIDEAHQLVCEEPTISLHVYKKPLIQICVYDPFSNKGSDRIFRCRV